tara:strand:- start:4043 stop:8185 length:4143 start_codon:yes stop_codon:yes gene_type:complete
MVTKNYYKKIVAVMFNNLSGGEGASKSNSLVYSENRVSANNGKIIFKEAEPLFVFPKTVISSQDSSPNYDLANFASSSIARDLREELVLGLGSNYNFADLYYELDSKEKIKFEKDGDTTASFGQKFLCKSTNIQRVDLLFSVDRDDDRSDGAEYDFSGDIVVSLHELATEISSRNSVVPENAIDYDPASSPIAEISLSQEDLATLGYKISGIPQAISFDFSNTLVADPTIEPSVYPDKHYAILISRRGSNRVGTLVMDKGYDEKYRKSLNGQDLNVLDLYKKQTSRFFEYDPIYGKYLDDPDSSLWFRIHSDTVEVINGIAYTEDGTSVSIPKTSEYVGDSKISHFVENIPLSTVSEGEPNYIVLKKADKFVRPSTHPRTGNFVYTRIEDTPHIYSITKSELEEFDENTMPIILSRVVDKNVRSAEPITGIFNKPGFVDHNKIYIHEPSASLLDSNLINRVITPDVDCQCGSRYRIVKAEKLEVMAGDLNNDGSITSADVIELLNVVGNTINSETTERKILGGELSIVSFLQSDLNSDDTVDGFDIELLEDAVDGYVNFTTTEYITLLRIGVENILEGGDYPGIFSDSMLTGETSAGSSTILFKAESESQALAIRIGDVIEIESGFDDSGTYYVSSKTVSEDALTVSVEATDALGAYPSFDGSSGFNVVVRSGTKVNCFGDNLALMNIPFKSLNYSIDHVGAPHDQRFLEACDLRRFVDTSFLELNTESCICDSHETDHCSPDYKNQVVIANDMFLPDGEIYSSPGIPYHGDFEYNTITVPMPPGTIEDCQVNLYENFVKAHDGTCKTKSGFPALKYSDGTYAGCSDSGSETDVTRGRVKFSQAIASLYVDAFVDGYAVDGYADATDQQYNYESIHESYISSDYNTFSDWKKDPSNASAAIVSVLHPSGINEPAVFDLNTSSANERFARLIQPDVISDTVNDFIIDFKASRTIWPEASLQSGKVFFNLKMDVTNSDGSYAFLKIGWRQLAGRKTELFYSGEMYSKAGDIVSDFNFSDKSIEGLGDEVLFRIRRVNEVFTAMYFDPTVLDTTKNLSGQYIRIGENPLVHPGTGSVKISFEMLQDDNPTSGLNYYARLHELFVHSDYSTIIHDENDELEIGRDSSTGIVKRSTLTFPISLTQKTNLISANLRITASKAISTSDSFNIFPIDSVNSKNLGKYYNYPIKQDDSYIKSFSPGTVNSGSYFDVDVTTMFIVFLSETGHLPGFYKGVVIEPDGETDYTMSVNASAKLILEYEDVTTGVIFKVGISLDPKTGIATFNTKNILYDSSDVEKRTIIKFGIFLKKSGFVNNDLEIGIKDLNRIGIGTCSEEEGFQEDDLCFFIAGSTATGTFVQGPFPCLFHFGDDTASNTATDALTSSSE